jgi:Integrase core domain
MTAPGQVFSWDITKLAGPVKGKYFDAYVMIDIYSRYIVGAVVHAHESGPLAVEMMKEIFGIHGVPQVVHADSKYVRCQVFPGFVTLTPIDSRGYRGVGGVLAAS